MAKVDWREFWQTYRQAEVKSEKDLYFEVGKTINKERISEDALKDSIQTVADGLQLQSDDRLLELCCGNGLMTQYLAALVDQIYAVDFVERLISHACQFRPAPNVHYICADAIGFVKQLLANKLYVPSKVLLGDALGYFEPSSLGEILTSVVQLTGNKFTFMATGIPSDELKWNFYNTPDRVRRYEENQRRENNTNDGIGRWWRTVELEELAETRSLHIVVKRQSPELSDFRVDAVFRSDS
jgi:SAM-dependent methyltransferase